MGRIRDHVAFLQAKRMQGNEFRTVENAELITLCAHREFTTGILERDGIPIALKVEVAVLVTLARLDQFDDICRRLQSR